MSSVSPAATQSVGAASKYSGSIGSLPRWSAVMRNRLGRGYRPSRKWPSPARQGYRGSQQGPRFSPKKGTIVSTAVTGTRGVYLADKEEKLPYRVVDADNHFYPTADAIDRYLDPKMRDRALLPG